MSREPARRPLGGGGASSAIAIEQEDRDQPGRRLAAGGEDRVSHDSEDSSTD